MPFARCASCQTVSEGRVILVHMPGLSLCFLLSPCPCRCPIPIPVVRQVPVPSHGGMLQKQRAAELHPVLITCCVLRAKVVVHVSMVGILDNTTGLCLLSCCSHVHMCACYLKVCVVVHCMLLCMLGASDAGALSPWFATATCMHL